MQVGLTDIVRKELNSAVGSAGQRGALGDNIQRALVGRSIAITAGAEISNVITLSLQVLDGLGNNLPGATPFDFWLSTVAAGTVSVTVPTSATGVTTGVALPESTAKLAGKVITDANGAAVIAVAQTATTNYFFNAVIDGNITSQAIAFA